MRLQKTDFQIVLNNISPDNRATASFHAQYYIQRHAVEGVVFVGTVKTSTTKYRFVDDLREALNFKSAEEAGRFLDHALEQRQFD
jgi:hypothetical protein